MASDNDDDVPLLADDDEQLITSEDREPTVEAVFVVTFDVKDGRIIIKEKNTFFSSLYLIDALHR